MYHWTYNNHFVCGFHKEGAKLDPNKFFSKIGSLSRPPLSLIEEAALSAQLVYKFAKTRGQELVLCLSGGIDSEAMAQVFINENIPFRVSIMRFNDRLNDFDIKPALEFCKKQSIDCDIFDLNIIDFFESGKYLRYGEKYKCQSPQLAAHLFLLDYIKGFPVLPWSAPEIIYNSDYVSYGLPGDLHCSILRYFVINERPGVPFFFLYTPELVGSFFHSPIIQKILYFGQRGAEVSNWYEHKCMSYIQAGFDVKPRGNAYTGFEKLKTFYDQLDGKRYGIAFNDRFRAPLEKLNPLPANNYQILDKEFLHSSKEIKKLNQLYKKQIEKEGAQAVFKKAFLKIYKEPAFNLEKRELFKETRWEEINPIDFSQMQVECKLWLCQELEKLAVQFHKKNSYKVWILAGACGLTGFLLFSRERIPIQKLKIFELDKDSIQSASVLNSSYISKGLCELSLCDINALDYSPSKSLPDIVVNTACEHFRSYDWLELIPKGILLALQCNDIFHPFHPSCSCSLNDFKSDLKAEKWTKILFEGERKYMEKAAEKETEKNRGEETRGEPEGEAKGEAKGETGEQGKTASQFMLIGIK